METMLETPFLPLAEILEAAESSTAFEDEVWERGKPTPEQIAFREAVLKYHIALRTKGMKPVKEARASELRTVPGLTVKMRKDAAEECGRMIGDARRALADAQAAGDPDALRTMRLTATNAFRSDKTQYALWRGYFPKYYAATQAARSRAPGGEHGPAAVRIAFHEAAKWIAAPGFNTHAAGIAIDLAQVRTKGHGFRNSGGASDLRAWRNSWFHKWLVANAASYGFKPYKKEPWHWEYKPWTLGIQREEELAQEYAMAELDEDVAREELGGEYDGEETAVAEAAEDEALDAFEEPEHEEYMSAEEVDEASTSELGEGETGIATEEFWGIPMPFVPIAPTPVPATGTPPRNATLVASCLPALASIPSMTAKNQSRRRKPIDEIVIHDTSSGRTSSWARIKAYLAKPGDGRPVSIHYIIGREERQIVAQVPEHRKAWHVAARGHNDRAVGIELFHRSAVDKGYTDWQYRAVSQLVYDLMLRYKVPPANVIAHKWVQSNRDDPRGFEWTRFGQALGQIATCAGGIDPSLVVANAADAGARGRAGTKAPVKEAEDLEEYEEYEDREEYEELDDVGEAEGLEEATAFGEQEPGEAELLEEEEDLGEEEPGEAELEAASEEGEANTSTALEAFDRYIESESPLSGFVDRIKGVGAFIFGRTLRPGDKGLAVAALQRALAALHFTVVVDGDFGTSTETAVRAFQQQWAFPVTGIADQQTKVAIASVLSGATRDWTQVPLDDRARYVMELLVQRHRYPVNGAAGLVGNLISESAILPNRVEGSRAATPMRARNFQNQIVTFTPQEIRDRSFAQQRGPRLPGVGLAQWTTAARRSGLLQHAFKGQQLDRAILFNMDAQVDYLVNELRTGYTGVDTVLRGANVTVNDAADDVVYRFEVPGSILTNTTPKHKLPRTDPAVQAVFTARRGNAAQALRAFRAAHPAHP